MKNFLNGCGFLTGIPISAVVIYLLSGMIYHLFIGDLFITEHSCGLESAVVPIFGLLFALVGAGILLLSNVLYLGTYLLSVLLISNKQRRIFLPYATSILYWVFMIGWTCFSKDNRFRLDLDDFMFLCFFSCSVWWVLSVFLAIIISRFTSDGFLQKTNRIFSKIGRCLCWIVLFFLSIFAVLLLYWFTQLR